MAEIVKTVKIETGSGERSVKSLRKEISDLRDALLNMDKGGEEWVKTAEELTKAQEDLNSVMKAGKEAVDADASSIAGMEARYKSLYQTYRLLSDEQRKSAQGMSMQKELSELSKNLNSVKKDAGNFKDNIGHYADDMMNAFGQLGISVGNLQGPFKLASQGSAGLKKAWDLLAKHPILLAITAIIGLFAKVKDAIKGNEELQLRWNKAMAAFKPIGDAVTIILDKVASLAVSVAEGISKVVTWINNLFGATKKLSDAEKQLAEDNANLIKQRREYNELNSTDEARIAELQEQASLTDDMREKEQMLKEARELQIKVNERNVELRQKEYDIIKATNEITPSSTEDLNKESQALIALNNARAEGEKKVKKLNKEVSGASNAASKGADEAKKKLDEILKRLEDNTKTELQVLEDKYKEELEMLKKYGKDSSRLTEEYEKNKQAIVLKYDRAQMQGYRDLEAAMLGNFVQPSTAAFNQMVKNAENEMDRFLKEAKMLGENFPPIIERSLVFESNGKLTEAAKHISDAFGLGLEEGMDFETIEAKMNELLASINNDIRNAKNAQAEWNREIEKGRQELEMQKVAYEENFASRLLDGDLDNYALGLAEITEAERKYYEQRSFAAKSEFDKVNAIEKKAHEQALAELGMYTNDKKILDQLYNEAKIKLEGELTEEERKYYEERVKNIEATYEKINETQLKFYEENLNAVGLTLNDELAIRKEYYDSLEQLRQNDLNNQIAVRQREKELEEDRKNSIFEIAYATMDSVDRIVDSYRTLLDANMKDGQMTEREAERKKKILESLEKVQLAVNLSNIIADTAGAWMAIDKARASEYILNAETAAAAGPGAAAVKLALDAKTNVTAAIRKAGILMNGLSAAAAAVGKTSAAITSLNDQFSNESGGGSVSSSAPQIIDSTPYSYTRELQTDVEREEQLNTPIYVRVTDIESAQARVRVIDQETTY